MNRVSKGGGKPVNTGGDPHGEWLCLARALILAINAAEGAADFALTSRLRLELAQVVYDHLTAAAFAAVAKECGWEWDKGTGPINDVAHSLGLCKLAVIERCGKA